MNDQLITISGVRGRPDANGSPELNLEDVARGLGFTRIAASGSEVIRWERVRGYLDGFGVPTCGHAGNSPLVGKDGLPDFIPENIFYKLCFKAENEVARRFQDIVTDEVLPAIRKQGYYSTKNKSPLDNDIANQAVLIAEIIKQVIPIVLEATKGAPQPDRPKKKSGANPILSRLPQDIRLHIFDMIISNEYSSEQIANWLEHEYGIQVSGRTIYRQYLRCRELISTQSSNIARGW